MKMAPTRNHIMKKILILTLLFSTPLFGMNKAELIDAIASDARLSKADSKRALNAYLKIAEKGLHKKGKSTLSGLGTLKCKEKGNRTKCGRIVFNPDSSFVGPLASRYVDSFFDIFVSTMSARANHAQYTCNGIDDDCDGTSDDSISKLRASKDFNSSRSNRALASSALSEYFSQMYKEFNVYDVFSKDPKIREAAMARIKGRIDKATPMLMKVLPTLIPDRIEFQKLAQTGVDSFFDIILETLDDDSDDDGILDDIAKAARLSKADAKRALDGFVSVVSGSLKKGDKVSLIGFGTFSISNRAARTGRNPQTGKEIKIAAKNVAKFKAGKALADTVK